MCVQSFYFFLNPLTFTDNPSHPPDCVKGRTAIKPPLKKYYLSLLLFRAALFSFHLDLNASWKPGSTAHTHKSVFVIHRLCQTLI